MIITLYKFTTNLGIATQISIGVFRFYELLKYITIEDTAGRSDSNECSIIFTEIECATNPQKLPKASFNGVEFRLISTKPDEKHMSQYFVFCMSTVMNADVIGDSTHVVELTTDIFDIFEMLMHIPGIDSSKMEGHKFFSHGPVKYYDINNQPAPYPNERWREIYIKRSEFKYQNEYRAALYVSNHFVERIKNEPMVITRTIFQNNIKMDFNLKLSVHSGVDTDGWRYIEFDISEFSTNMMAEPCKIIELS